jgi:hypothetical protein
MCPKEMCSIGFAGALVEPLLFYAFWQILYTVQTEILSIESECSQTPTFKQASDGSLADSINIMHKIAKAVCRTLGDDQAHEEETSDIQDEEVEG